MKMLNRSGFLTASGSLLLAGCSGANLASPALSGVTPVGGGASDAR